MAEKKKPGVMMYFKPMRDAAEKLNDAQLGQLFRAILAYADPDEGTVPKFDNDILDSVWPFVQNLSDRDDERYRKRSIGNRYSRFCQWYKHYTGRDAKTDVPRETWEDAGCPTYSQWAEQQADTDSTSSYKRTNVENVENVSASVFTDSVSNSISDSVSKSESDTKHVAARMPAELLDPALSPWLRAWIQYNQENGKRMTDSTRDTLVGEMNRVVMKYGAELIEALIDEAIENGWRTLRWEKLDKDPDAYERRWLDRDLDKRYAQD